MGIFLRESCFDVRSRLAVLLAIGWLLAFATSVSADPLPSVSAAEDRPRALLTCQEGSTLASGAPDPGLFARGASKGVRAHWCERYDANGATIRTGAYWEIYANGRPRTQGLYVDSRLTGPITIRNEDGSVFLRGFLEAGEWSGPFEIYHPNGELWFEARFDAGRLDGALRTHFADGALESESFYQRGREDGLARSFYPSTVGGRLKSEAHVEADHLVGRHRVLDRDGELVRSIDWDDGPAAWQTATPSPAAPDPSADVSETPESNPPRPLD